MKLLVLDVETTTFQKGNPFSRNNKCCAVAYLCSTELGIKDNVIPWEYNSPVSIDYIKVMDQLIKDTELFIAFNAKFDLHWLRRCGIIDDYSLNFPIWDCQLAQFIISHQQMKYPSLEKSCKYWDIVGKFIDIEIEYWSKGIDTPQVPWEVIYERGRSDVELTYKLYQAQQEYLRDKPDLLKLIELSCEDSLSLAEIEWNGLKYDVSESAVRAEKLEQQIKDIDENLRSILGNYKFNFNSNDHVSVLLYGGTIKFVSSTPYKYICKSGKQQGQEVIRFKHEKTYVDFPRLAEPLERSELAKPGYWSTDEPTLRRLNVKGRSKEVVQLLLKRSEIERLVSTYYRGFPKKILEMDWATDEIHSQLNQCVVITGRLSSSGPNQQNLTPEVNELVKTRY